MPWQLFSPQRTKAQRLPNGATLRAFVPLWLIRFPSVPIAIGTKSHYPKKIILRCLPAGNTMPRKIIYIINPISGTRKKSGLHAMIEQETRKKNFAFKIFPSVASGDYSFLKNIIKEEKI